MLQSRTSLLVLSLALLSACAGETGPPPEQPAAPTDAPAVDADFEKQVDAYIAQFPRSDTHAYMMKYTGGDAATLNTWILGKTAVLVQAGQDKVVRMNNDTYYKMAFVDLRNGPVVLSSTSSDTDRFSSFQLMDDRNANYHNVIRPKGSYTLYMGDVPAEHEGELIEVPTAMSVVIVRVEVKDKNNAADTAAAAVISDGIAIAGPTSADMPALVAETFDAKVVDEGNKRMDEAFKTTPFSDTVVGPGQTPGNEVPVLKHAAGTKGGWGGPGVAHSAYETIFHDENSETLDGSRGHYVLSTEAPPVDAFWSITVYDTARGGFLHPNADNRYHINNTTAVVGDDGKVQFLFSTKCESTDVNCLEIPAGPFDYVSRYYLPKQTIRDGSWVMPKAVRRTE